MEIKQNLRYHRELGKYFIKKEFFLDSEELQRKKLLECPYQARLVNRRKTSEIAFQIIKTEDWDKASSLFLDLDYLEAKAESNNLDDLVNGYHLLLSLLPINYARYKVLDLIAEALKREFNFIANYVANYPQILFQSLFNLCWWYDNQFDCKKKANGEEASDVRLYKIMETWFIQKMRYFHGFVWVRSLVPPVLKLNSQLKSVLKGHINSVNTITYSPDGDYIYSGSDDGSIIMWDSNTGKVVKRFLGHSGKISKIYYLKGSKLIISKSSDCTIRYWKALTGEELICDKLHGIEVKYMSVSQDEELLLTVSKDNYVNVSVTNSGKVIYSHFEKTQIRSAFFINNTHNFLLATKDSLLEHKANMENNHYEVSVVYRNVCINIENAFLTKHYVLLLMGNSYSDTEDLIVLDVNKYTIIKELKGICPHINCCSETMVENTVLFGFGTKVRDYAFSVAGDGFAFSETIGKCSVEAMDLSGKNSIVRYPGHENSVRDIAIHPFNNHFASCSEDGTIRIWDQSCRDESTTSCEIIGLNEEIIRVRILEDSFEFTLSQRHDVYVNIPECSYNNRNEHEVYWFVKKEIENYMNSLYKEICFQPNELDIPSINISSNHDYLCSKFSLENGIYCYYPYRLDISAISISRRIIAGGDNYTVHIAKIEGKLR